MGFMKTRYQGKRLAPPAGRQERTQVNFADMPERTGGKAEQSTLTEGRRVDKKKGENKPGFWANYGYLLVTAAVVLLVFRVLLQLAFVPSGSMERTIPTDSLLISWHFSYLVSDPQPQRGDVITFWNQELDKLLVKRVIGLPGEEITFSDGYVYVDGKPLDESYLQRQGITSPNPGGQTSFVVPEGCLFMLGDNRTSSTDSRFWKNPYVDLSDVRARVMVCIPISFHPVSFLPRWRGLPLPILGDIHLIG